MMVRAELGILKLMFGNTEHGEKVGCDSFLINLFQGDPGTCLHGCQYGAGNHAVHPILVRRVLPLASNFTSPVVAPNSTEGLGAVFGATSRANFHTTLRNNFMASYPGTVARESTHVS
jgi:hypothetical protein